MNDNITGPQGARLRSLGGCISRSVSRCEPGLSASSVLLLTWALAACASTPVPTEQVTLATAAVAHATAAGGQELAPGELALARDKLRRANLAVQAQDNEQGQRLAQQAQVDALLSEAKAESIKARKAADEVLAASRALREEMGRKAP